MIDFGAEFDENLLFARSNASIDMPKSQQQLKLSHDLPDDMHFSSRDFQSLFLKPKQLIKFKKLISNKQGFDRTSEGTGGDDPQVQDGNQGKCFPAVV